MLDLDDGGTIEEEELRIGLRSVGKTPSDDELKGMMKAVDEDESGEIDLAEFIQFMVNLQNDGAEGGAADEEAPAAAAAAATGNGNETAVTLLAGSDDTTDAAVEEASGGGGKYRVPGSTAKVQPF